MKLLLIRHPRPDVPDGTCYGRSDVPPQDDHLLETIEALRARWSAQGRRPPAAVFSSPLQRCARVARGLAGHTWPEPTFDPRIQEMHFGHWEGRLWSQLPRDEIDAWRADITGYTPPGGESLSDVAGRILQFVGERLSAPADPDTEVVLVTHVGVIQTMSRILRGEPLAGFGGTRIDYSTITTMVRRDDGFELESLNQAP